MLNYRSEIAATTRNQFTPRYNEVCTRFQVWKGTYPNPLWLSEIFPSNPFAFPTREGFAPRRVWKPVGLTQHCWGWKMLPLATPKFPSCP